MPAFTALFLAVLAFALTTQLYLARRHRAHVMAHRGQVPEAFRAAVTLEAHQKAADYTVAKVRFQGIELAVSTALLLAWTLGGGLDLLDRGWRALELGPLTTGVAFMLSAILLMGLLDLPFTLYRTFVIEQRFGFNRTTPTLFIADLVKQTLLALVLGVPLLWVILWLMGNAGLLWWLYAWLVWMGFSLLMLWAYPTFIAPLFNKFKSLEDQVLKARIEGLLTRCGFASSGIFVMDGSRRSSHGNAYFTGLGSHKRIVFFDTLITTLTHDETEAVLAHELGHFRRKHVIKGLVVTALSSLAGLALLGWLATRDWFYGGLGMTTPSLHAALMLFMLVIPTFTFFLHPLLSYFMRRHEFEADDYAAEQSSARDLVSALVKLYKENASTLTPDPLHSAFYDSHPPAPVRVAHLLRKADGTTKEVTA